MSKITLFTSQAVNGSSPAFVPIGDGIPGLPLVTLINIWGTFDGASIQLEFLKDGGDATEDNDWYSTGDTPFTASASQPYSNLSANVFYRLTLSGAGAGTSIGATAYHASN